MNNKINAAIEVLCGDIVKGMPSNDAMKLTQSVLNLTHAKATIENLEIEKRKSRK